MKKPVLFLAVFAVSITAFSQNVSYKVLQDDPQNYHPRLSINTVIAGIDLGIKNISGCNIYLGAFGHYMISDRLGIQVNANRAILSLGRLGFTEYPPSKELNAGAMYFLSKSTKSKKIKIILKMERGTTSDGRNVQTTTYIMVPGTRQVYMGVRGGLYYKGGAYGFREQKNDDINNIGYVNASLNSMGVYAGLMHRSLTNLIVNTDKFGKCFNSLGIDVYLDAMLIPVNSITVLNDPDAFASGGFKKGDNITDNVNKYIKSGPMGFRLGFSGFQIAPKSVIGKKFGMSYNFEAGMLPYQGWFIKGGVGITLVKK